MIVIGTINCFADSQQLQVAEWLEHWTSKQRVMGSSQGGVTNITLTINTNNLTLTNN